MIDDKNIIMTIYTYNVPPPISQHPYTYQG